MESNIQKSLHHLPNSTAWLLLRLISGVFIIEMLYVVFLLLALSPFASQYHLETTIGLWILQTIKFFLLTALIFKVVAPWGSTQYYLSNNQLIKYVGLTRRDETAYDLHLLKGIEFHQGWLGRQLNYGDIHLTFSSSGYHQDVVLMGIYGAKKYERVLREIFTKQPADLSLS